MGLTKIRDYLTSRGVDNGDITYDSGNVKVKGKNFMAATPNQDGYTYGDLSSLNSAYNNMTNSNYQDQTSSAIGQYGKLADAMRQREQFSYDPNTDPQYQTALQQARQNATIGTNNAMVGLGSRGIGNSSVAVDRASQINQSAMSNVSQNVLPQLLQQAYQRWKDKQDLAQQDFQNQGSVVDKTNGLYQQGVNNQVTESGLTGIYNGQKTAPQLQQEWLNRKSYGDSVGEYQNGQKSLAAQQFDYSKQRDAVGDQQWERTFDENRQQYGLEYALKQAAQSASIANSNADNSRQADSASFNKLMDIWQATGKAPAGIPGVPEGTSFQSYKNTGGGMSASDYKTDPEFANDIAYMMANPEVAKSQLTSNPASFIQQYGYEGYQALRKAAGLDSNTGG